MYYYECTERNVYRLTKQNSYTGPCTPTSLRLPKLLDTRYMKVVRLSALRTAHIYLPPPPPPPALWIVFLFEVRGSRWD